MSSFNKLWIVFMICHFGALVKSLASDEEKIKIYFEATSPKNIKEGRIQLNYEFKAGCDEDKPPKDEGKPPKDEEEKPPNGEDDLPIVYENCNEVPKSLGSGIYNISFGGHKIEVFCEIDDNGSKYLVIQRRINGSQDFYRNWTEYENGFGNLNHEFWIGNKALHLITSQTNYKLRVDLEAVDSTKVYAVYDHFSVGSPETKYKLNVSGYSGNAGDSLVHHNGQMFSTFDQDNDVYESNCAVLYKGAWWYGKCHDSNLNGFYYGGVHTSYADGVNWNTFRGHYESMKTSVIKIY